MGSSDRLFNRDRTIHEILGGGLDVILWRRKNLTIRILVLTVAAWLVFEVAGHTFLSFTSSVFLLLFTILFLWSKSAAITNRPAPPLPHLYLSEETVNKAATFIRDHVNTLLFISEDIALGRDSRMFIKVALCLLTFSLIGSFTNFLNLCCTSFVLVLTVPALYERYKFLIEKYGVMGYRKMKLLCVRCNEDFVTKFYKWVLEKQKLG